MKTPDQDRITVSRLIEERRVATKEFNAARDLLVRHGADIHGTALPLDVQLVERALLAARAHQIHETIVSVTTDKFHEAEAAAGQPWAKEARDAAHLSSRIEAARDVHDRLSKHAAAEVALPGAYDRPLADLRAILADHDERARR